MKTIPTPSFVLTEPSFPVIRIDYKGRILYANRAAFPLLREWNCLANDYIPEELISENPAMLDLQANFDFQINTEDSSYYLDVIGFKESGYVGMYGFRTETKAALPQRKRMLAV
jgi:hypothetical protein